MVKFIWRHGKADTDLVIILIALGIMLFGINRIGGAQDAVTTLTELSQQETLEKSSDPIALAISELEQGLQLLSSGQEFEAADQLYQVIIQYPETNQALIACQKLCQLAWEKGNQSRSQAWLTSILSRYSSYDAVVAQVVELVKTARQAKDMAWALKVCQAGLHGLASHPDIAKLYVQAGEIQLATGQSEAAFQVAEVLRQRYPSHEESVPYVRTLARQWVIQGEFAQAETLYKQLDIWPAGSQPLYADQGMAYSRIQQGDFESARSYVERILIQDAGSPAEFYPVLLELAGDYQAVDQYQSANNLISRILQDQPAVKAGYQAVVKWAEMNKTQALELLTEEQLDYLIEGLPILISDMASIRKQVGQSLLHQTKEYSKARRLYQAIIAMYPNDNNGMLARKDLAWLEIQESDPNSAMALVHTIQETGAGLGICPETVREIADYYNVAGYYQEARSLYEGIRNNYPGSDQVILAEAGLIITELYQKESTSFDSFASLIEQYQQHPRLAQAIDSIGCVYLKNKQYKQASEIYRYFLEVPSLGMNADLHKGLAIATIYTGDPNEVSNQLDSLIAALDGQAMAVGVVNECAQHCKQAGRYSQAAQWYQWVLDRHPDSDDRIRALSGMAALSDLACDFNAGQMIDLAVDPVEEIFTEYRKHPDLELAALRVGEDYYERGSLGEPRQRTGRKPYLLKAIGVFNRILNELPPSRRSAEILLYLGDSYRLLNNYTLAVYYYQRLLNDWPADEHCGSVCYTLAMCYQQLSNQKRLNQVEVQLRIRALYEQIVRDYPDTQIAHTASQWLNSQ